MRGTGKIESCNYLTGLKIVQSTHMLRATIMRPWFEEQGKMPRENELLEAAKGVILGAYSAAAPRNILTTLPSLKSKISPS